MMSQQRTDPSVRTLCLSLDEFSPAIPDVVTEALLAKAGAKTNDARVTRLVSLAAQSAAVGLLHQAKLEWQMILGAAGAKSKEGDLDAPFDMQLEHVLAALECCGVDASKPKLFSDTRVLGEPVEAGDGPDA